MKTKLDAMQIARFMTDEGEGSCVQCPNCHYLAGLDVELPAGSVVAFEWASYWDVCDSCGAVIGDEVEMGCNWAEPIIGEKWEMTVQ